MIVFPNCKINLGLSVLRKRADGFHDLETIFYPLQVYDALEVMSRQQLSASGLPGFHATGLPIVGEEKDNLCIKAWQVLKKDFPRLPPIDIHLHKAIPLGAGLGGGSADGAFTLKLLNDKYQLNLTTGELIRYAALIGSDCPFFIINKPCFASSRGEMLEAIPLSLDQYRIVVVNPGIHINTGWAFSQILPHERPADQPPPVKVVLESPASWRDKLVNDFELPVFRQYPQIMLLKEYFYEQGALYASMSGSGSTVFGIFEASARPVLQFPKDYTVLVPGSIGNT